MIAAPVTTKADVLDALDRLDEQIARAARAADKALALYTRTSTPTTENPDDD